MKEKVLKRPLVVAKFDLSPVELALLLTAIVILGGGNGTFMATKTNRVRCDLTFCVFEDYIGQAGSVDPFLDYYSRLTCFGCSNPLFWWKSHLSESFSSFTTLPVIFLYTPC